MSLNQKSELNLTGVHPDLCRVVRRAATMTSFIVVEGVRTLEKQREYFQAGKSKTMNSRHLAKPVGRAVDLCPLIDTDGDGDLELSWKLKDFFPIRDAMFTAAQEESVPIVWGADWNGDGNTKDESFVDGPHFELDRKHYA